MRRAAGFTLIEVMVAVAIVAIALPALLFNIMGQLDNTGRLRDKAIAQWVASNRMAQVRLANTTTGAIPRGKVTGSDEMLGRKWYWQVEAKAFPQPELAGAYGIQVEVSDDSKMDSNLVTLFSVIRQGN
jgi:general secretion pathway protein I